MTIEKSRFNSEAAPHLNNSQTDILIMRNPTPLPGHVYKDSHGATVTVERVEFNRVTFYRSGYQFPCAQPVERFIKEFSKVKQ